MPHYVHLAQARTQPRACSVPSESGADRARHRAEETHCPAGARTGGRQVRAAHDHGIQAPLPSRFRGRTDVFAKSWLSERYGKKGWSPQTRHRTSPRNVTATVWLPLTGLVIERHLKVPLRARKPSMWTSTHCWMTTTAIWWPATSTADPAAGCRRLCACGQGRGIRTAAGNLALRNRGATPASGARSWPSCRMSRRPPWPTRAAWCAICSRSA